MSYIMYIKKIFTLHEALFSLKLKINFIKLENIMVMSVYFFLPFPFENEHKKLKSLHVDTLCFVQALPFTIQSSPPPHLPCES